MTTPTPRTLPPPVPAFTLAEIRNGVAELAAREAIAVDAWRDLRRQPDPDIRFCELIGPFGLPCSRRRHDVSDAAERLLEPWCADVRGNAWYTDRWLYADPARPLADVLDDVTFHTLGLFPPPWRKRRGRA